MQKLNDITMISAVSDCIEQDGFRVGIYTGTYAGRNAILSNITNGMNETERAAVLRTINSTSTAVIEFKNGSIIRVLGASENTRGHAFYKVLYEGDIDKDILNNVVRHTEKLKRTKGGE